MIALTPFCKKSRLSQQEDILWQRLSVSGGPPVPPHADLGDFESKLFRDFAQDPRRLDAYSLEALGIPQDVRCSTATSQAPVRGLENQVENA